MKNKTYSQVKKREHQTFFSLSRFNLLRFFFVFNDTSFPPLLTFLTFVAIYHCQLRIITVMKISREDKRMDAKKKILCTFVLLFVNFLFFWQEYFGLQLETDS